MADLSDIENALVAGIVSALYPNGVNQKSAIDVDCRIYRGWPTPSGLNSDLAAGMVNVTITPGTAADEILELYFDRSYVTGPPIALVASVSGQSIILSGSVARNLTIGMLIDDVPFIYEVNATDSISGIAANLAALVGTTRMVSLVGPAVSIPGARSLIVRVVGKASLATELRRQRREFQISCWCPNSSLRDQSSSVIDLALAGQSFIDLSDGTKAHISYASTQIYDQSENAILYRRDLRYRCDYAVTATTTAPVMVFGSIANGGSNFLV